MSRNKMLASMLVASLAIPAVVAPISASADSLTPVEAKYGSAKIVSGLVDGKIGSQDVTFEVTIKAFAEDTIGGELVVGTAMGDVFQYGSAKQKLTKTGTYTITIKKEELAQNSSMNLFVGIRDIKSDGTVRPLAERYVYAQIMQSDTYEGLGKPIQPDEDKKPEVDEKPDVDKKPEGNHALYIHGYEDGIFKPNKSITRNEVALMLARNLGYVDGETTVTTAPFKDVPAGSYGSGAIALLKEMNIFHGDNGNFRGKDNITRAEMAKVVASYMKLDPKKVPVTFKDTNNLWSTYYIEAIRDAGVIAGYEDGTFQPQNNLTRAEAVRMLNRMFDRGPLNGTTNNPFPDVLESHWAYEDILEAATSHKFTIDKDGQEWLAK